METEATAPSTTAGPVLVEVPEPLVPAPPEFLCTWGGMRVEFREGLTESSVEKMRKFILNTIYRKWRSSAEGALHGWSPDQQWQQKPRDSLGSCCHHCERHGPTSPLSILSKTFIEGVNIFNAKINWCPISWLSINLKYSWTSLGHNWLLLAQRGGHSTRVKCVNQSMVNENPGIVEKWLLEEVCLVTSCYQSSHHNTAILILT